MFGNGLGQACYKNKRQVHRTARLSSKTTCGERGSNTRPSDLQSDALPTELSPLPRNVAHPIVAQLLARLTTKFWVSTMPTMHKGRF